MTAVEWVSLPLGLGRVSPMTADEVCDWILSDPVADGPRVLANVNLHGAYLLYRDPDFHRLTGQAAAVLVDGWPILQLAKTVSSKRLQAQHRVGSTDWLETLLRRDPPLRVVAVGGTPDSSSAAAAAVAAQTRNIRWSAFDGYDFKPQCAGNGPSSLDAALANSDVVLIGMGMPTQERWILENRDRLPAGAVVANVGGCFDYLAGSQKLAPRWMGRFGLEWLYRLVNAPGRLAGRYLWEPLKLAAVIARHRGRPPRREGEPA